MSPFSCSLVCLSLQYSTAVQERCLFRFGVFVPSGLEGLRVQEGSGVIGPERCVQAQVLNVLRWTTPTRHRAASDSFFRRGGVMKSRRLTSAVKGFLLFV